MKNIRHKRWVRGAHFLLTISFLALTISGFVILMSHPRLYWGQTGNDLTPELFELPISRNYHHGGWTKAEPFYHTTSSPVSAARTYDIFNDNGAGRSTHFLAGWILVLTGLVYLAAGFFTGHFRNNLTPRPGELRLKLFLRDFVSHFSKQVPDNGVSRYGLLQKIAYLTVIFLLFPIIILTGMTMSPAITASYPFLLKVFFGEQSARTIHFFAAAALVLFLMVHVVMVARTGFKKNILAITIGKS